MGSFAGGGTAKEELGEKNRATEHSRNIPESFLIIDTDLIISPLFPNTAVP